MADTEFASRFAMLVTCASRCPGTRLETPAQGGVIRTDKGDVDIVAVNLPARPSRVPERQKGRQEKVEQKAKCLCLNLVSAPWKGCSHPNAAGCLLRC